LDKIEDRQGNVFGLRVRTSVGEKLTALAKACLAG
jgi:hypothetical protein